MWGHYVSEHVLTPKAKKEDKPFLIIMGDEAFYDKIDNKQAKHYLGDGLQSPLNSMEMWKKLDERFNIYLLRKSYPGYDDKIKAQWGEAIGSQKIIAAESAERVVDQAIGIIAKGWGQYTIDFKKSMAARQDDDIVKKVDESIRAVPEEMIAAASKKTKKLSAAKSKKLA